MWPFRKAKAPPEIERENYKIHRDGGAVFNLAVSREGRELTFKIKYHTEYMAIEEYDRAMANLVPGGNLQMNITNPVKCKI